MRFQLVCLRCLGNAICDRTCFYSVDCINLEPVVSSDCKWSDTRSDAYLHMGISRRRGNPRLLHWEEKLADDRYNQWSQDFRDHL